MIFAVAPMHESVRIASKPEWRLADAVQIGYTKNVVARFRDIQAELARLSGENNIREFIQLWLGGQIIEDDPFHALASELALEIESPRQLLDALLEAVSQPDIPPDVAEVRIMSLHKSKGLNSPVVIIAGCVEGLLPTAPDTDLTPAENKALLEEQRRLFFVGLTRVKATPEQNRPGILVLTSSRSMSLADAMQSGIRPASVRYGRAYVHTSRFIQELGPSAPAAQAG
jgi:DNA helicase-2/ATP-dependent DNA helicase PcrA